MSDDQANAGFSTIEMLVAFAILSLGLGVAVQSVWQARMSLARADDGAAETILVKRVMSEEMPRLLKSYKGKPLLAKGPSWQAGIRPFSGADPQGPVEIIVEITRRRGGAATYADIVPPPPDAFVDTEVEQPPAGEPE